MLVQNLSLSWYVGTNIKDVIHNGTHFNFFRIGWVTIELF